MALVVVVCLLLAAGSLLGPSEPSFDAWAWLIWGRELAHFGLDTTSGPSWKPLPVAFTTLFAPLSAIDDELPPALWMVVARAGGLLALVMAARVAARLVGGARTSRVVAGAVAVTGIVLTPDWTRYLFHGNETPLAVALALWAVERHLDGQRRWALVLGALVCLARPELAGFLALYGAWLWLSTPAARPLIAGLAVLVPAAWVVPDWVGSGNPLAAGQQASSEPSWSLSHAAVPWRAALELAQTQAWVVLELLALFAVLCSLPGRLLRRPAQPGAVAVLAGFAAAVFALYAGMTQAGFSGNPRYVLVGLVAIAVVGGAGAGALAEQAAGALPRVALPAVGAAVLALALAPELRRHVEDTRAVADESIERARLHSDLELAVDLIGQDYLQRFGPVTTNRSYQTHLAWDLSVPINAVHGTLGRGIVIRAAADDLAGVVRILPRARRRVTLAQAGSWTVSARPPRARHVFTWPIVGFRLRTAAARIRSREQLVRQLPKRALGLAQNPAPRGRGPVDPPRAPVDHPPA